MQKYANTVIHIKCIENIRYYVEILNTSMYNMQMCYRKYENHQILIQSTREEGSKTCA